MNAFKRALNGHGKVLVCDSSPDAPAFKEADRWFVVPRVDDGHYVEALLALCKEHRIGLLIPALEPELPLLSLNRASFQAVGTIPLVSSLEVISTCYDKLATNSFLAKCGVAFPLTFISLEGAREAIARGRLGFPLVVKPRWGVSSIATRFPEDDEALEGAYALAQKEIGRSFLAEISSTDFARSVLIQQRLSGDEYGLDVINDLDGRYVCTFARRKLQIKSGQTDCAVSVDDDRLQGLGRLLGESLGHLGPLDCDVIFCGNDLYVIDMNPRLGGAYPFSDLAGANLPAALITWVKGERPNPTWLRVNPGTIVARSDNYIITRDSVDGL